MTSNYAVYLKLSSFLQLQNVDSLSKKKNFGKMSLKLVGYYDSFISFFLPDLMYIFGSQGFWVWKGHQVIYRFLFKSFVSSSICSLISTNTHMSRNPHKNNFLLVFSNFVQHMKILLYTAISRIVFLSREGARFLIFPVIAKQTVNRRKSWFYFPESGMPAWEQIRLLAALLCR